MRVVFLNYNTRKIFRNIGGRAIPLELSIIKNKIDTAAVARMENLPTEGNTTHRNIVIYIFHNIFQEYMDF